MTRHTQRQAISRRTVLAATVLGAVAASTQGTALASGTAPVGGTAPRRVTPVPVGDPAGLHMWKPLDLNGRGHVIGSSPDGGPTGNALVWAGGKLTTARLPASGGEIYLEAVNDGGQLAGSHRGGPENLQTAMAWPGGAGADPIVLETDPQYRDSRAYYVNNRGHVVYRTSELPARPYRAFVYDLASGARTEIVPPASHTSGVYPRGFNDSGQLISSVFYEGSTYTFFWDGRTATDLTPLGATFLKDLNARGQVLGTHRPAEAGGYERAFLWQDGRMTDLGALGPYDVILSNTRQPMNDLGDVIGLSGTADGRVPFLWSEGRMTPLPTGGRQNVSPLGINNRREIAGRCSPDGTTWHACLWRNGRFTDLGTPRGFSDCQGLLVTEQGDVLAFASDQVGRRTCTFQITAT
ncbi:hypothetical protein ACH4OW_28545 [Streptomyces sp. NPDC017056]|uniref:hypothetical protein n=1 Tax=Streptomyces sp. NPDC017056 TaxID=3364973 RepID=UPI0037946297